MGDSSTSANLCFLPWVSCTYIASLYLFLTQGQTHFILFGLTQVLHITHDIGKLGEHEVLEARAGGRSDPEREKSQRRGFLRELHAMNRLRSPHTVGLYGAITSRPDRLVLVMELLPGGDLRTLLKKAEQPLPEERSWQIIRDICAGMNFLHSKETVHGDLKSPNVLLDGDGRAKVRLTCDATSGWAFGNPGK